MHSISRDLENCPLNPQTGTPLVTVTLLTPPVLTPTNVQVLPTSPAGTTTPAPVQTVISPSPAVTALPPQSTPTPSRSPRQPRTGLHDPEGFIRWYFGAVWRDRDYQDLWDNYQTSSFKSRPGSGSYEEYAAWWSSVERVDVHAVDVIQNDGTHDWVRVNLTFTMTDGRMVSGQEYDYELLYDPGRGTWMFDYRT